MPQYSTEALSKPLRVTASAARTNFCASSNGIPGCIRPFNFGVLTHPNACSRRGRGIGWRSRTSRREARAIPVLNQKPEPAISAVIPCDPLLGQGRSARREALPSTLGGSGEVREHRSICHRHAKVPLKSATARAAVVFGVYACPPPDLKRIRFAPVNCSA